METYSFHDTKNITSGEGGVLLINNDKFKEKKVRTEVSFLEERSINMVGSSYLPSELNAAILLAQLENINKIQEKRLHLWNRYFEELKNVKQIENCPYILYKM